MCFSFDVASEVFFRQGFSLGVAAVQLAELGSCSTATATNSAPHALRIPGCEASSEPHSS
jgi:hypothetical protein